MRRIGPLMAAPCASNEVNRRYLLESGAILPEYEEAVWMSFAIDAPDFINMGACYAYTHKDIFFPAQIIKQRGAS